MQAHPISTAVHPANDVAEPKAVLLYCPDEGGWLVGVWWEGWWRLSVDPNVILTPTHWAALPEEPG